MEIRLHDQDKIVEVWLSSNEKENARQELTQLCNQYKSQKYTIAFFESGNADLLDNTINLLRHNK